MFSHFIELLRYFRAHLLAFVAGVTTLVLILSIVLLNYAPTYTAAAVISTKPSDTELSFTRGWLGSSQYDPSNILTQTHVERILSRPTATRAVQIVLAEAAGEGVTPPEPSFGARVSAFIWRTWATLNYGRVEPVGEEAQLINSLLENLEIEIVEGSYILRIEASWEDPVIAAMIANAVVDAYEQLTLEGSGATSSGLVGTLDRMISEKLSEIEELDSEVQALRAAGGIIDYSSQLESVTSQLNTEKEKLNDDEVALSGAQRRLVELQTSLERGPNRTSDVRGTIAEIERVETEIASFQTRLINRREVVAGLERERSRLSRSSDPLRDDYERRDRLIEDLSDLRDRRVEAVLMNSSELSQFQKIQMAEPPLYPSSPQVFVYTVAAMIGSIVVGMFLITAVDLLRDRVRTVDDLRRAVGVKRTLGALPPDPTQMNKPRRILYYVERAIGTSLAENSYLLGLHTFLKMTVGTSNNVVEIVNVGSRRTGASISRQIARTIDDDRLKFSIGPKGTASFQMPDEEKRQTEATSVELTDVERNADNRSSRPILFAIQKGFISSDELSIFAQRLDEQHGMAPIYFVLVH